jgi:hypothetical protein
MVFASLAVIAAAAGYQKVEFVRLLKPSVVLESELKAFTSILYSGKRLRIIQGALKVSECLFEKCSSEMGGAALVDHCLFVNISDCVVKRNRATFGGGMHLSCINYSFFTRLSFVDNRAEYIGGVYLDGVIESPSPFATITFVNFTNCRAVAWTGGLRLDHGGGPMRDCAYGHNAAGTCGALFDFAWKPSTRNLTHVLFVNNTAEARAGAYCAFHIIHQSQFTECVFVRNACTKVANSIYVESVDSVVRVAACLFSGSEADEIGIRFDGSVVVRVDCKFEVSEALETAIDPPQLPARQALQRH